MADELCHEAGFEVLGRHAQMVPPGESIHELGTCRMGSDPKTSVLNKFNQCHDIKNLFVMDGSSFTSGGSQNPTLTILALAMRASEYLAEQMRTRAISHALFTGFRAFQMAMILLVAVLLLASAEPPVQPIPYSHKQRIKLGVKCFECHTMPDSDEMMAIPETPSA